MPDTQTSTTELTSQYTAQVAGDLERNAKEQDRITAEIDALQEQLRALQHDHTVLTSMQKALGATDTANPPAPEGATAPSAPRQKTTAQSGTGKRVRAKKTATAQGGDAVKKPADKKPEAATKATAAKSAQPTLVELIRRHLTDQGEPRSAAEIATALGQAHPDRTIKTTVVRTTVEGLVAKSHVQRTKQGSSVYYTATDAPEKSAPATAPAADVQPETS
ncbi:BlaI/MecI/CopY family transcriptional regulator [Streptomyces sp. NPDC005474]|uniref:BlaI/MecI/CopY family transcriptional regulator n=1 Tax=Streptomyces sp. NPDC005474 TaxID=3154878 RepID=UPI00345725C4